MLAEMFSNLIVENKLFPPKKGFVGGAGGRDGTG